LRTRRHGAEIRAAQECTVSKLEVHRVRLRHACCCRRLEDDVGRFADGIDGVLAGLDAAAVSRDV
jgi:hypothetical protein